MALQLLELRVVVVVALEAVYVQSGGVGGIGEGHVRRAFQDGGVGHGREAERRFVEAVGFVDLMEMKMDTISSAEMILVVVGWGGSDVMLGCSGCCCGRAWRAAF